MQNNERNSTLIIFALLFSCFIFPSCKKENPAPLPTADFFVDNNGCVAPCYVYFYDQSMNATSWKWDFGNLFTSTTQNDSNKYNLTGFYDVTHWVWNIDGAVDSVVKTVQIY